MGLVFTWLEDKELSSRCSNRENRLSHWTRGMTCCHVASEKLYPQKCTGVHWEFRCVYHVRLNLFLFGAVTSVKKYLSSFFPLYKIEDSSTHPTLDHLLGAGPVVDAQRQATFDFYPLERWCLKVHFWIC